MGELTQRLELAGLVHEPCAAGPLRFTREVVVDVRASEAALAEARKHLSDREVVELILMSGFYIMLARLTESLGVDTEPPMGSALIRQIEGRVAARKAKAT